MKIALQLVVRMLYHLHQNGTNEGLMIGSRQLEQKSIYGKAE